jgi:hypothetical protein
MGTIVLIGDPPVPQRSRPGDWLLTRLRSVSLDAELARGCPPESSRLLAARAAALVTPRRRRALAGYWDRLLGRARQQLRARTWPGPPAAAVPLCADQIVAATPAIRDLISRLAAPLPVPARGVAMARVLLTEASSPVYNPRAPVALAAAVAAAAAELDPARPLLV